MPTHIWVGIFIDMTKTRFNFFLIYLSVIGFSIYPWVHSIDYSYQVYFALGLIFLFGIPHGAIDHVIYFEDRKPDLTKTILFYAVYLGLIGVYTACWFLWPYYSLIFFLFISAYHFGQSQFNFLSISERNPWKILVYITWGSSLLMGLNFFHYGDVREIFHQTSHFANFDLYLTHELVKMLFVGTTVAAIITLVTITGYFDTWSNALYELLNFGLLHLVFYLLPPLVGFTIYFVFWHSIQVMIQEFRYLQTRNTSLTIGRFIRILTPHSLISIFGAVFLIVLVAYLDLDISPILLVLIFLSVLTLPHSIVMDRMYGSASVR
jgi:Brp/Blh family beta-carotene 15,15'-monooxygenase